jgi:hypothetical protein
MSAPVAGNISSSSADRMVGADHAEVRYFTRYVILILLLSYISTNDCMAATTIMVFDTGLHSY